MTPSLLLCLLLVSAVNSESHPENKNENKIVEVIHSTFETKTELPEFPKGEYIAPKGGVEQYRPLVEKYFPKGEVDNALVIMAHESGGNPNAVSRTNDHGLMQIHAPLWTNFFGVTTEQLKDPNLNIELAYKIWDRADGKVGNGQGSWKAWSTYKYLSG